MTDLYEDLSPSEKLDLWAEGKRPVKVKLCSDEKLCNYFDSAEYNVRYYCKSSCNYNKVRSYITVMALILDDVNRRVSERTWPFSDSYHSGASMKSRLETMVKLSSDVAVKQNTWLNANTNLNSTYPSLNSFLQTLVGKITNGRLKIIGTSKKNYEKDGLQGHQYVFEIEPTIPGAVISQQTFSDFDDRMLLVQKAWAEKIKANILVTCVLNQNKIFLTVKPNVD